MRVSEVSPFGNGQLELFADSVWTAATPIRFAGAWFPHIMTAVRLHGGDLWLHSPCRANDRLINAITSLGRVTHVVAPNWFHDLYLTEYRTLFPEATFWAPSLVRRQRPSVIDRVIDESVQPPWFTEMPHVTLPGVLTFNESIFYHVPTGTLIVADLLSNAGAGKLAPIPTKLGYRFIGLNGTLQVFPVLRWLAFANRTPLKLAARRILDFDPSRLIVGHGRPVTENVPGQLRAALQWLL